MISSVFSDLKNYQSKIANNAKSMICQRIIFPYDLWERRLDSRPHKACLNYVRIPSLQRLLEWLFKQRVWGYNIT